jgi:hypothetical protein
LIPLHLPFVLLQTPSRSSITSPVDSLGLLHLHFELPSILKPCVAISRHSFYINNCTPSFLQPTHTLYNQTSFDMDWDHDTCLSCDRHIADGEKFCSQTCRLADLEQAGGQSEQITPSSLPTNGPSWMSWQLPAQSTSSSRTQFQLAPALNFSAYKNSSIESPPVSPRSAMAPRQQSTSSYFAQTSTSSYHQSTGRGLTTSPSRSSLSSVSSTSSSNPAITPGISDHAATLLRAYSGAFDQDRNWKRRVTLG